MRSAFRQMKGSIRSFSRGNLCDCPNKQGSPGMNKIKLRCTNGGKWFQSANAKEVTCPDCVQKARKEKLAAKTASSKTPGQTAQGTANLSRPSPPPPPKPKPAPGSTSHWFDKVEDIKVGEPEQPQRPKLPPSPAPRDTRGGPERPGNRGPGGYRDERGPGGYRDERGPGIYREGVNRGPAGYRPSGPSIAGGIGQRPRQPMEGGLGRGPRPGAPGEPRLDRSEEHTSELQSHSDLVCRLLLEKKNV